MRAARGYEGIGRPELGERLGVSASTVLGWEQGRKAPETPEDQLELVRQICAVTETPASFFYE
jgi:DNA-binding transcriptional regulator YiaG